MLASLIPAEVARVLVALIALMTAIIGPIVGYRFNRHLTEIKVSVNGELDRLRAVLASYERTMTAEGVPFPAEGGEQAIPATPDDLKGAPS